MTESFKLMKEYLNKEECCASEYDDKSFTVLEFSTFENVLTMNGATEDSMTIEDKQKIANKLQKKFKFAEIGIAEDGYYIDFDFTLLKEDVNCNLKYILNAIHSFHDNLHQETKQYLALTGAK